MKHPTITARLESRGAYRVALALQNHGDREAHLYRPNACQGGKVENDVFVLRDGAVVVPYTGRYAKRPAPRPQDFDAIPPRGTLMIEVDLASAYAIVPGASYTVLYEAFHDNPVDPEQLWLVTSNTVVLGG